MAHVYMPHYKKERKMVEYELLRPEVVARFDMIEGLLRPAQAGDWMAFRHYQDAYRLCKARDAELAALRARVDTLEGEAASLADTVAGARRNCDMSDAGIGIGTNLREPIWELSYRANALRARVAELEEMLARRGHLPPEWRAMLFDYMRAHPSAGDGRE